MGWRIVRTIVRRNSWKGKMNWMKTGNPSSNTQGRLVLVLPNPKIDPTRTHPNSPKPKRARNRIYHVHLLRLEVENRIKDHLPRLHPEGVISQTCFVQLNWRLVLKHPKEKEEYRFRCQCLPCLPRGLECARRASVSGVVRSRKPEGWRVMVSAFTPGKTSADGYQTVNRLKLKEPTLPLLIY